MVFSMGNYTFFYNKFCQLCSWLHLFMKMTKNNESNFFSVWFLWDTHQSHNKKCSRPGAEPSSSVSQRVTLSKWGDLSGPLCPYLYERESSRPTPLQLELWEWEGVFCEGALACSQSLSWGQYVRMYLLLIFKLFLHILYTCDVCDIFHSRFLRQSTNTVDRL